VQFVDGAVELQVNSADANDGNYAEFYVNGATDMLRVRASLTSDTTLPPDPNAEAEISIRAVFHNDTQDFGSGTREGDVSVRVQLRQAGDGRLRAAINTDRRNANGDNENYDIIDGDNFEEFDLLPSLNTIYELGLQIDRDRGVVLASIDDLVREIALPTQLFEAYRAEANISLNHRGSSGRAVGRIHSIETDLLMRDFTDGPGLIGPYAPEFNSRNPGRDITIVDGRARFLTDATLSSGNDTRMFVAGGSDFVGASVELSSESVLEADGAVRLGVAASLYNDFMAGGGSEGRVFAEIWLVAEGDGSLYAEYCAFRSNDADFSDTTELLGSETREYAIATQILDIERPFNSANLRASDGSVGVGFVDDFALNANPVPLAESSDVLVSSDAATDGGGTDGGTDGGVAVAEGSGGGGGCSIAGTNSGHSSLAALRGGMDAALRSSVVRGQICFP